MSSTKISYEQVRKDAETVKDCANTMSSLFDDFTRAMTAIGADDVFAGNASESLSSQFATLKGRLGTYVSKVEEFSAMISNAADTTEAAEQKIAANIDNIGTIV